jgi:hypothetical protein
MRIEMCLHVIVRLHASRECLWPNCVLACILYYCADFVVAFVGVYDNGVVGCIASSLFDTSRIIYHSMLMTNRCRHARIKSSPYHWCLTHDDDHVVVRVLLL